MSILGKLPFHDEKAAFAYLENALWPDGPVCPHCGTIGNATKLQGKATRIGVWKCKSKECRKQFTVKVGTVFEHGRMPLHKMLQAAYLMCCSKKGISSHQLHRVLQISYKAAWFLSHRIREAMREGSLAPMGGAGSIVEADETYFGNVKDKPKTRTSGEPFKRGRSHGVAGKRAVLALVERGGSVRTFHIDRVSQEAVTDIVRKNVARKSTLSTDESKLYTPVGREFSGHLRVHHSRDEYVRGEAHTNTLEGYFSEFKRGMKGVYQHCSEKHLHRYLGEFDFRYNERSALGVSDDMRTQKLLVGVVGKRLTYRIPH